MSSIAAKNRPGLDISMSASRLRTPLPPSLPDGDTRKESLEREGRRHQTYHARTPCPNGMKCTDVFGNWCFVPSVPDMPSSIPRENRNGSNVCGSEYAPSSRCVPHVDAQIHVSLGMNVPSLRVTSFTVTRDMDTVFQKVMRGYG